MTISEKWWIWIAVNSYLKDNCNEIGDGDTIEGYYEYQATEKDNIILKSIQNVEVIEISDDENKDSN